MILTDYIAGLPLLLMGLSFLVLGLKFRQQKRFWEHLHKSRQETLLYLSARENGDNLVAALHFNAAKEELDKASKYL